MGISGALEKGEATGITSRTQLQWPGAGGWQAASTGQGPARLGRARLPGHQWQTGLMQDCQVVRVPPARALHPADAFGSMRQDL